MNSHKSKDDRLAKRFFVLRATKVFGPFSQQQIEKGKLDGKFLPTDKISHLANGPWQDITTANLVTQNMEWVSEQTSNELITAEVVSAETASVDPVAAEVVTAEVVVTSQKPTSEEVTPVVYPTWKFGAVVVGSGVVACFGVVFFFSWLFSGGDRNQPTADESVVLDVATSEEATTSEESTGNETAVDNGDTAGFTQFLAEFEQQMAEMRGENSTETEADSSYTPPSNTDSYSELDASLLSLGPEEACEHASAIIADTSSTELRTAYLLLDKTAGTGHARSTFLLGLCYLAGWGVTVDETAGRYWVEQAATSAEPEAMYLYAGMIQEGQYPEKGNADCLYWLGRSAEAGYRPAQDTLNEYKLQQVNGLIGAMVLSAFGSGDSGYSEDSDTKNQEYWDRRRREEDYWTRRTEQAAANGDKADYDYSRQRIP